MSLIREAAWHRPRYSLSSSQPSWCFYFISESQVTSLPPLFSPPPPPRNASFSSHRLASTHTRTPCLSPQPFPTPSPWVLRCDHLTRPTHAPAASLLTQVVLTQGRAFQPRANGNTRVGNQAHASRVLAAPREVFAQRPRWSGGGGQPGRADTVLGLKTQDFKCWSISGSGQASRPLSSPKGEEEGESSIGPPDSAPDSKGEASMAQAEDALTGNTVEKTNKPPRQDFVSLLDARHINRHPPPKPASWPWLPRSHKLPGQGWREASQELQLHPRGTSCPSRGRRGSCGCRSSSSTSSRHLVSSKVYQPD